MRLTIVVFALAVALAWGKPHRVENSKNILAEINKNAFGNTVLSMVHLATATGDGVDQINLLLQNIAAQLNQQQATADKVHENDSATCEKLINDFESAINYHETQIVAVTKLRDDTTEALAEAETEVRQATKDLEQNGDTYASESALRVQQHSTWEEKDAEADANIVAIDEASKIVQHLQAGVAFSQLKSRFDKVTARLTETKHALFKVLIHLLFVAPHLCLDPIGH
jgi:chromosome segregation ATPase